MPISDADARILPLKVIKASVAARCILGAILVCALIAPTPALANPSDTGSDVWALIIGINHHQGKTRTNIGAVGDAVAFQELLSRKGWPAGHVRVLTDFEATAPAIREGMQWLVDNCAATSYCLFHYSGHTKQMATGGDGERVHEYLWPSDNRWISDTEFSGYMRQLRGYSWIDISACEPAGFDDGISNPRRLFTAAAQESEKGFEHSGWHESVWTGLLVDKGLLQGESDTNGDGLNSLEDALSFAIPQAPQVTSRNKPGPQHPYRSGGEETQWFTSGPGGAAPAAPARSCFLGIFCS
jgi:hypothetical protein